MAHGLGRYARAAAQGVEEGEHLAVCGDKLE